MWDILLLIFFVLLSVFGAIWVCIIFRRRQKALKEGDHDALAVVDIITRHSGYCEQSTKNFTTVPFRVSTASTSSSRPSSKSSTLTQPARTSVEVQSEDRKEEKILEITRKSDQSWKNIPLDLDTKIDSHKFNEKAYI